LPTYDRAELDFQRHPSLARSPDPIGGGAHWRKAPRCGEGRMIRHLIAYSQLFAWVVGAAVAINVAVRVVS
jgi:hypothetical protein